MTSTNSIAIQILHNVIGNDSQWFWAMAQFFAVAITLGFIWRQIHLQRMGNTLASLAQFESRWTSPEMFEASQSHPKATPRPVDRHRIGTPKPP